MDISLLQPDHLTDAQLDAWRSLADVEPTCDSPFYAPEYTLLVAQSRPDVEVAVIKQNGELIGFFPFQRSSSRIGRPVGWKINDFQGVVSASGAAVDSTALLDACRLSRWHFDHVPVSQTWCSQAQFNVTASPVMDLSAGYAGYLEMKRAAGDLRLKTLLRKSRKLERENGLLRFELHVDRQSVFDTLLQWKSEHLNRARKPNALAKAWARQTLNALRRSVAPGCRGVLSALYSGDAIVALHFGLRNDRVLHWWVTAYNAEFHRYSPGALLLLRLARECGDIGIRRIDLGKGSEAYKRHFMTSATPLAEGSIARSKLRQAHQRIAYRMAERVRTSTWMYPAVSWLKQVRSSLAGNRELNP